MGQRLADDLRVLVPRRRVGRPRLTRRLPSGRRRAVGLRRHGRRWLQRRPTRPRHGGVAARVAGDAVARRAHPLLARSVHSDRPRDRRVVGARRDRRTVHRQRRQRGRVRGGASRRSGWVQRRCATAATPSMRRSVRRSRRQCCCRPSAASAATWSPSWCAPGRPVPRRCSPSAVRPAALPTLPPAAVWSDTGPNSVGPPAAPAGYLALAAAGRLPLDRLAAPAIELAAGGFPWAAVNHRLTLASIELLRRWNPAGTVYLPDGEPIASWRPRAPTRSGRGPDELRRARWRLPRRTSG